MLCSESDVSLHRHIGRFILPARLFFHWLQFSDVLQKYRMGTARALTILVGVCHHEQPMNGLRSGFLHGASRLDARFLSFLPQHAYSGLDYLPDSINTELFVNWLSTNVLEADYVPEAEPNTCDGIYQQQRWKDWAALGYPNTLLLTGVQGEAQIILLVDHC